jgi:hypothetical protein
MLETDLIRQQRGLLPELQYSPDYRNGYQRDLPVGLRK